MQTHTLPKAAAFSNAGQHSPVQLASSLARPRRHACSSTSPSPCASAGHPARQCAAAASAGAPGLHSPLASEPQRQRGSVQTNVASFAVDAATLPMPLVTEPLARAPAPVVAPTFKHFSLFLDQYAMGEMLGQGTYSKVYVARERDTMKEWVVKVQQKMQGRKNRMPQICKEVELMRALSDARHVARLQDVFEDARHVYCVQELCETGDLGNHMDCHGCLDEGEARAVMRQVLEFLADAHDRNICYGDIKPSNFAIKDSYPSMLYHINPANGKGRLVVKAVDFGCCQQYEEDLCLPDNTITGTPAYMAPEVMAGCHGKEVDVWAAGVMMYQLMSDRFPFWDTDVHGVARLGAMAIRTGISQGQVLFTSALWRDISEEAKDLIKKMLTRPISERIGARQALEHPWFRV